jgi:hypothetical protein
VGFIRDRTVALRTFARSGDLLTTAWSAPHP